METAPRYSLLPHHPHTSQLVARSSEPSASSYYQCSSGSIPTCQHTDLRRWWIQTWFAIKPLDSITRQPAALASPQQQYTLHTSASGCASLPQEARCIAVPGLVDTFAHTAHNAVTIQQAPSSYSRADAATEPGVSAQTPQAGFAKLGTSAAEARTSKNGLFKQLGGSNAARALQHWTFW